MKLRTVLNNLVLVTGGTGFLGQNVVRALRECGLPVRVLARPHPDRLGQQTVQKLKSLGVEVVWGDILDLPSLEAATQEAAYIFHLAGRLLIPGIPDQEYQKVHIEGTRNLLNACRRSKILQRVIYCSTTGVLGPTGVDPQDESTLFHPSNIYERTKAEGELLALELASQYDLSLSIGRPGLVYGPGDLHLLGWFRFIQSGRFWVIGNGNNLLHPIYIDDFVEGFVRMGKAPLAKQRVYHLVGERPVSMRRLAGEIAGALGRRLPSLSIPLPVAMAAASFFEALPKLDPVSLPLTRNRVKFMTESRVYSGERARLELGFVASTPLNEGVRKTVAWYRNEGWLK